MLRRKKKQQKTIISITLQRTHTFHKQTFSHTTTISPPYHKSSSSLSDVRIFRRKLRPRTESTHSYLIAAATGCCFASAPGPSLANFKRSHRNQHHRQFTRNRFPTDRFFFHSTQRTCETFCTRNIIALSTFAP